jgi:hypothetical protein
MVRSETPSIFANVEAVIHPGGANSLLASELDSKTSDGVSLALGAGSSEGVSGSILRMEKSSGEGIKNDYSRAQNNGSKSGLAFR